MSSAAVRAPIVSPPSPDSIFSELPRGPLPIFPRSALATARVMQLPVVPASRLEIRPAPPTVPTGIATLDALTGGLPRGALTEFFGPASSGRTSVLISAIAQATHRQELCALVDVGDAFHPESAGAARVNCERLLWVRCSGNRWERRMEQALKTTDLLLQGGGFGMIAVDLGDVPPQFARRIPLTSWFRFRRAVENTPSVLLVVEQEPYAKTCASLVLRMEPTARNSRRSAQSDPRPTHAEILHGLSIEAEVVHARVPKKPAQSAAVFEAATPWAG